MTKDYRISMRAGFLLKRQLDELAKHLDLSITDTISLAVDRMYQQEIKNMSSQPAYRVSYITERQDGSVEIHSEHDRIFPTRERAVAHARHLTDTTTESNGVFVGEWTIPFAAIIAKEDQEEIRVTATVSETE